VILLSNGGSNVCLSQQPADWICVGTVDGLAFLRRESEQWNVVRHALRGCSISAVTQAPDGALYAASHGVGVARSIDAGITWQWVNKGIDHLDLWSARAGKLQNCDVVCVGSLPAHLYISEDSGESWRELTALREVKSIGAWCFPPPPHAGHIKDITFDGNNLMVGVEIGALLVSQDFGKSFVELPIDPNPVECDTPDRPACGPAKPPDRCERYRRLNDKRGPRAHLDQEHHACGRGIPGCNRLSSTGS